MKKLVLLFFFFSLPLSEVYSAELTLQKCVELALENNTGLKAFETDIIASDEDVRISRSRFFPSLKLKGDYTLLDKSDVITFKRNSLAPSIPPQDVEISAENSNMYSLSLILEQPVFTGGNLTHSFRKFRILNEEAQHNFARQKALIILAVKEAFYGALKDRFQRETLEKLVESKKERLRVMRERLEEGYVPREDLLTAETDLAASEFGLYKIQSREQFDLSKLKKVIYYQSGEEVSLKADPLNGSLAASLQEVKETALANSEDIKMSRKRIKAAGEDISIAKGDLFPKTSLHGGYTVQKETNITRPKVWMFSAQVDWADF